MANVFNMERGMLSAQEENERLRNGIILAIRAVTRGMSGNQINSYMLNTISRLNLPRDIIQKAFLPEGPRGAPSGTPVSTATTEVRTPGPTMASYGDVRSLLAPGSNVTPHVDLPDIGWPGEDFSKFPKAEVKKTAPPMGDDFGAPLVNRDVVGRAAPPVSSYVRPVGTPLEEKAKYMARPPMPKYEMPLKLQQPQGPPARQKRYIPPRAGPHERSQW